jgi:hypothetical protein
MSANELENNAFIGECAQHTRSVSDGRDFILQQCVYVAFSDLSLH